MKKRGRQKKHVVIVLFALFVISLVITIISANWFEDFKARITGKATSGVSLNITIGKPSITNVWNDTMTDVSGGPNAGPFNTPVVINFTAYHGAGAGFLNHSSSTINFTKSDESDRFNASCENTATWGNYANYTCTIYLWWWDGTGTWQINATIEDNYTNLAFNDSTVFQVGSTSGFQMSPNNLTWNAISAGSTNQTSNNDPLLLNNTGNVAYSVDSIEINGTDLVGETDPSLKISSGNFSVDWQTGGAGCSGAACLECAGTRMNITSGYYVNITGANLTTGNYTINDGHSGQEELYFCLRLAGSELTNQAYSNNGTWMIRLT